jgi:tetratricopeptide (TPR) repeat protein
MWLALLLLVGSGAPDQSEHQTALTAYKQHKFAEAEGHFTEALKAEKPGSSEYNESILLLGQSFYLESKFKDALPWLEKAVTFKPTTPEAPFMLGNAYILTQQYEKSVGAFAQLFGVKPESAAARVVTARMMLHQDADGEAAKQAQRALEIDPNIPEAHFLLGEVAILHAEIDDAIKHLKKEIEINPSFAMAHYRLGDAYTRRELWDEAMGPLERSVWLNPNYSAPFILLGKSYFKRQEFGNAEGVLKHALKLDPQNLSAHYLLGQTYMQLGKTEDAKKEMDRWRELKGNNPN